MLHGENSLGEGVRRVAGNDRHPLLKNDRTRVQVVVHEMNSGAALGRIARPG